MKQIHFATKNRGKVSSLVRVLSSYDIEVVQVQLGLPEPRSDDLMEIAREKIVFAYRYIRGPCVAHDSGFYIHSLNGFPRAFVNFALKTIGIKGILKLVEGENRECEFRNCLAYLDNHLSSPVYFESGISGKLSEESRGVVADYHLSGLSTIFIPDGETKTLGEMSSEEYLGWGGGVANRNRFAKEFAKWFSKR